MRAHVSSEVGDGSYPVAQTVMPQRRAAPTSIAALRGPVLTSRRRSVSRSRTSAGNGVRSRIATATSNPVSRDTSSSGPSTVSVNVTTSAPRESQSARLVAGWPVS